MPCGVEQTELNDGFKTFGACEHPAIMLATKETRGFSTLANNVVSYAGCPEVEEAYKWAFSTLKNHKDPNPDQILTSKNCVFLLIASSTL